MTLYKRWYSEAYNEKADKGELQRFWQNYFALEKSVYEKLLSNPDEKVTITFYSLIYNIKT